jgi:hypothetical protein
MKLHKGQIAKRQLEAALDLFFSEGEPLAVVTLAAAAEEVLGDLLQRRGGDRMLDHIIHLDKKLTGTGRPFAVVIEEVNGIRNALKHAKRPEEDDVELDPTSHAVVWLSRALANYSIWEPEGVTPRMLQFYEHLQVLHPGVLPKGPQA